MDKINLKREKFAAFYYVSEAFFETGLADNGLTLEHSCHQLVDEIVMRVTNKFLVHHERDIEFKWYASWWQELRQKLFPSWYLSKFPSRWEVKRVDRVVSCYPTIKIDDAIHQAHLIIQ